MEGGQAAEQERVPLSAVVSECINWWFEDMLMEAKTGDINMQVLVGQMYYCGYGIPRDANKKLSVVGGCDYFRNASDSDSDDS